MKSKSIGHTTCRVTFEDYSGDLHKATIRMPLKTTMTAQNINRLASAKARHKSALLIAFTCYGRRTRSGKKKR